MPGALFVALSAALVAIAGACQNPVGSECAVAADCGTAALCVAGECVADERVPVLPTEGEGDGPGPTEGEGEGFEGEGDVGEGEAEDACQDNADCPPQEVCFDEGGTLLCGACLTSDECDPGETCQNDACVVVGGGGGEGEGEGPVGEGEGEVPVGEGEGEPADPCAGVVCPEFQVCNAGVCDYSGPVCDAFQGFVVPPFADLSETLDVSSGTNVHDRLSTAQETGDHLLDAYTLDVAPIANVVNTLLNDTTNPPPVSLTVALRSTAFDPFLAVIDDAFGPNNDQCQGVAVNDDFPASDRQNSLIELPLEELAFTTNNVVVTTFADDVAGPYTLRVRPVLCGLETDSLATFNGCARALSTTTNTCALNNPCERNAQGLTTGSACCIKTGAASTGCARSGDGPIVRFAAPGVCD